MSTPAIKKDNEIEVTAHSYGTTAMHEYLEKYFSKAIADYNPDLMPCQNPALRQQIVDVTKAEFRESLLLFSSFLEKQTVELIREIFDQGWIATNNVTLPEFDAAFREQAIITLAKALVVNAALLTRFQNEIGDTKVIVFSSNFFYRRFANNLRNITEIYLEYPAAEDLFSETNMGAFCNELVGFLTQHCPDTSRPNRFYQRIDKDKTVTQEVIGRNAVLCMPYPDPTCTDGIPFMYKECQTAVEKIYLRFYELLLIHKGGVNKTMILPDGIKPDVVTKIVKEYKRGLLSLGSVITVAGVKLPETFSITETPVPELNLDVINSHLSEDAKVSKQKTEGEAASGALGGVAPEVNAQADDDTTTRLKPVIAQFLKDIYDVFFQVPQKKYENGKAVSLYEIEFKEAPDEVITNEATATQDDPGAEAKGPAGTMVAHSVDDDYVTYTGHMLPSGVYDYKEQGRTDFYSRSDIESLCKRSVNKFYLELDHSGNPDMVEITEGVGYGEIIGFEGNLGADITKLHIKRPIAHALGPKIKLSPYFNKIQLADRKLLSIRNCAIMVHQKPRAEDSGLKAEATQDV